MLRRRTLKPVVEGLENRVVLTPLGGVGGGNAGFCPPGPPESVEVDLPEEVAPPELPEKAGQGMERAAAGAANGNQGGGGE